MLSRKVMLAVIAVLLAPAGVGVQIMCSVFLLFGAVVAQLICNPFRDKTVNSLEVMSIGVAIFTIAPGAVLVDGSASLTAREVVSVLIAVVNAAFIFGVLVILLKMAWQEERTQSAVKWVRKSTKRLSSRMSTAVSRTNKS